MQGAGTAAVKRFLRGIFTGSAAAAAVDWAGFSPPLRVLPAVVLDMDWVAAVAVDGNALAEFPPAIGRLTALTRLSARCNRLETIPREIRRCKQLQCLLLDHNRLGRVPKCLFQSLQLVVRGPALRSVCRSCPVRAAGGACRAMPPTHTPFPHRSILQNRSSDPPPSNPSSCPRRGLLP